MRIASGGGLERRKLKLSTRSNASDLLELRRDFCGNRKIGGLIQRDVPGQTRKLILDVKFQRIVRGQIDRRK